MQNLIFSLNATLPVFLVMVVGYALGQLGFLPPAFCKASDRLTFKVTLPLMLFLDMGSVDILHDFRPRFVLFCFAATLVGILTVWAGAKRFLKDKTLVGEFVQAGYRSSAAVLGVAFIQNIYGSAGMAPLMILGSVPLFNIFAVLILMLESPEQRGVPDPKQLLRGVATNPILLGIVFGTVYALLPFTLPQIATKTISSIASLTTPLSLLSIGASFEGTKAIKKLGPTLAAAFIKTVGLAINRILDYDMLIFEANRKIQVLWPDVEDRIEVVFQKRSRIKMDKVLGFDMEPTLIRVKRSRYGWYQQRLVLAEGKKLEAMRPMKGKRDYPEGQRVKLVLRMIEECLAERAKTEEILRQLRRRTARVSTAPIFVQGKRALNAI